MCCCFYWTATGSALLDAQGGRARMSLLPVDVALLDLHGVDEDESEAVALSFIELLFSETNAVYRQHCLAKEAISSTAVLLTASVYEAVACSQLRHEDPLAPHRFYAEPCPTPEINDRHAARCLPQRSPEKPTTMAVTVPTQRVRAESRVDDRSRMSLARKRPNPEKKKKQSTATKPPLMTIPQAIVLPEIVDEEDPEDDTWRLMCLKELSDGSRFPAKLESTTKWTTFTRQTPVMEPRISLEAEIIDTSSSLLYQEVTGAASVNAVKMKSNLTTFSSISTSQVRCGSAASSSSVSPRPQPVSRVSDSKGPSLTGSQSVPILSSAPRHGRLNDSLSRKRSTHGSIQSHALNSTSAAEIDPWQFELQEWTPREIMRNRFSPDMMVASGATIPTAISLAPGVGFRHGESTAQGPERRENDHTMSRKRFELHQRLATDQLLHESVRVQSPGSPSSHSSAISKSPLSTLHSQASPCHYETVPPDPVPVPSLSPIAKNALVIPRNHLSLSASTPSLRVRTSSARKRTEAAGDSTTNSDPFVTTKELEAMRRARPSTALGAVFVTSPRQKGTGRGVQNSQRPQTCVSKRDAAASAYLREFPKPHAGTIQLNARKAASSLDPASGEVDSARQRLAWIS